MKKNPLRSLVPIITMLLPICVSAQETEVSVYQGKILAQNAQGQVEAVAGQRAIWGVGQKPIVTPDNQMIGDLLEMDNWVEQEKADQKIRIDGTSIQITSIDSEKEWTFLGLAERGGISETTSTVRIGLTSLGSHENFYDMEGREIPFYRKEVSSGKGYYYLHFPALAPTGGKYKFIDASTVEPQSGWLVKDENVWHLSLANDSRYCLNYFRVVLPPSAIFVESSPAPTSTNQVNGRTAVIIRNYTGPEAKGRYRVTFLWPDHDGTTLKDLPARFRGIYDGIDDQQARELEQQVLPCMQAYQQACRERDVETCMKFNPSMNKEALGQTPEIFDLVSRMPAESVKMYKGERYRQYRPVVWATGGDWEWYWRQTPNGWQIFSQESSRDSAALLELIKLQREKSPGVAIGLPDLTPSPEETQEARATIKVYQQVCRAKDLNAYVDFLDFEALGGQITPAQMKEALSKQGAEFFEQGANSTILSIEKAVKYSKETLLAGTPTYAKIAVDGPVLLVRGSGGLGWYLHKTAIGWKLLSQEMIMMDSELGR